MTFSERYFLDSWLYEVLTYSCFEMFQDPTKSLLLWGSSGTGKTLALVAALKRKVAYYKRRKIPYKVLVCSFGYKSNCKQLFNDLKTKYGLQTILEECETEPILLKQIEDDLVKGMDFTFFMI